MHKFIYYFGSSITEGDASMKDTLGGKGANLAQMCKLGLPIPPGFTISTGLCITYSEKHSHLTPQFKEELLAAINQLEQETNKKFGSGNKPLLLSVRSGAKVSMPGMMDTILNLGMNDDVAKALATETNNPRFAYDSYRRFLEMYGSVVLGISSYLFEESFEDYKIRNNIKNDSEITPEILLKIISAYKAIIFKYTGHEFESDPYTQLQCAIEAVLASWMCPRAITYRKINNISDDIGTAVNVQSMVFGNKGDDSATGVVFTRCPTTGKKEIFGEFLVNAQGEDVVAGIRTPSSIIANADGDGSSMQEQMPALYDELSSVCNKLEQYFTDMQDIEFTIEEGKLYILQTRNGKRAAASAVKIAVDMVLEGVLSKQDALMRIDPESLNQLLHTAIDYSAKPTVIATGLPASPGATTGIVVFSPYDAEELSIHHKVILVRNDTSPEDIKGMHVSSGMLTARGGMTSHAAVVARGMGTPCVCGVNGLVVNEQQKIFTTNSGHKIKQGDTITIDGSTGKIIIGDVQLIESNFSKEFDTILKWADEEKKLNVRANAETALDASVAIKFGASGIGLCRTEHMFFDNDKIPLVREMIIASDYDQRMSAIERLKPLQISDFKSLFEIMKGKPVNIRLLDPPLHEFLPTEEKDKRLLAESLNVPQAVIDHRLHALHESNPMLGHRGCRLGISYPEIYIMQVEAILEAMHMLYAEQKIVSNLELMIPLISEVKELQYIKKYVVEAINSMEVKYSSKFNVKLGTMIELPRAALMAGEIAKHVEYFSFGSNDLTQTTFGISRDDVGSFLPDYLEQKILLHDPFVKLDEAGVGELIDIAIKRGQKANPNLTFGICGEHAGDPESIDFFNKLGMHYISCSPYRIPIARVAAARSKISLSREKK
ncbi:MAG: pyruvate, phosphate dikinase [Rickettsiaceae bacterium]|nr:pyruvate, phosphate dikinase [Rickettsiaceae bacterium]MDP4832137.1 pyruvate, phosphate dikinase [Rickettsiaceae bacterium]MDP5020333.1 pyruvate, phosphate dikinase [Rickettsiaceae bacterium]MDP5082825.1 pyruvate, phosphate dikinase [Rickettsiaceae bacterium]